ncbi:MAG: hypothetical protein LQ343_007482 [Gyalolechia ehrenbergii]|nr:MAG: hypothetical protein LQ343_007482 [Gyalolechia ehrenbergii]
MQSGISASPTLHSTFHTYLSDPTLFALLVTITSERLEPLHTLSFPSPTSTFLSSLHLLTPHLTPTQPLYIILRSPSHQENKNNNHNLTAITYVPDHAPVRSKTLFASTRLTLVRELGAEKFPEQIFATEAGDLSAEGWEKWERHGSGEAPLTREEERIAQDEQVELAGVEETDVQGLASNISDTEPRYSFFRYTHEVDGTEGSSIVFIYTCPAGSKVKERMVYASFKKLVMDAASAEGEFEVTKKLEASSPSEITPEIIAEEFQPKVEQKQGFARPKRPGKR